MKPGKDKSIPARDLSDIGLLEEESDDLSFVDTPVDVQFALDEEYRDGFECNVDEHISPQYDSSHMPTTNGLCCSCEHSENESLPRVNKELPDRPNINIAELKRKANIHWQRIILPLIRQKILLLDLPIPDTKTEKYMARAFIKKILAVGQKKLAQLSPSKHRSFFVNYEAALDHALEILAVRHRKISDSNLDELTDFCLNSIPSEDGKIKVAINTKSNQLPAYQSELRPASGLKTDFDRGANLTLTEYFSRSRHLIQETTACLDQLEHLLAEREKDS